MDSLYSIFIQAGFIFHLYIYYGVVFLYSCFNVQSFFYVKQLLYVISLLCSILSCISFSKCPIQKKV